MNKARFVLLLSCFLLCHFFMSAQSKHLLSVAYIPEHNLTTIGALLEDMQRKTDVTVSFSKSAINTNQEIALTGKEKTVGEVLQVLAVNQQINVVERRNKILLVPVNKSKSQNCVINGYVKDEESREVLIGANVYLPDFGIGTTSNDHGFYSVSVPPGNYRVVCAYIGYRADTLNVSLKEDSRTDVLLTPQNKLAEVKVVNTKFPLTPDHIHLTAADINSKPALFADNDLMRALQNYSGVQTAVDGSSSVMVRGGDPGQNLNLLDGVPLYYVDHFFGLTSIFNTDAVKSVDFHKGAFPARYGGRLSSIIDVNTKDGDMQRIGGQFSVGLLKTTLNLEGPIIKNKASVSIAGRRSWLDAFLWPMKRLFAVNFYDLNVKANYIANESNRFYLSFYTGRDKIKLEDVASPSFDARWGNKIASAKWATIITPKLFLNTVFTYSQFDYKQTDKQQVIEDFLIRDTAEYTGKSTIKEGSLLLQSHWYANEKNRLEAGIKYAASYFIPTEVNSSSLNIRGINPVNNTFNSNEVTVYFEDEIKMNDKWKLRPGLHWANWFNTDYNYTSLQPRFYLSYQPLTDHIVYLSFTQMSQFLHFVNNNTYGLSSGFWVPSTNRIKPEEAIMGTLGYTGRINDLTYNLEGYYKDVQGVTTYTVGKDIFDNSTRWQDKMVQGRGWSYGSEVSLSYKAGKFYTTVAYTLSWTWRKFEQLNDGKPFPYRYDRRHNIKASLIYKPKPKFDAAANWTFMSGEAITLPDQVFPDFDNNLLINPNETIPSSNYTYNYTKWNNYRLPPIHRLDVGVNFHKFKGKHVERTWALGVFNAYGRHNVMAVELVNDEATGEFKLKGMSFLQFVPYISYKLKF